MGASFSNISSSLKMGQTQEAYVTSSWCPAANDVGLDGEMADDGNELSSWTNDAVPREVPSRASENNGQIAASAPQNDWSNSSPSNGSDATEPPASTWHDSCLPVLDSLLPSVAASVPSTATDGTCWSATGAVAPCSEASSPLVWADCDSDGVLGSVQQQQPQSGMNHVAVNAQVPQSGNRAFVPGRAARGSSPDIDVPSRASSGQSSAGTTSGVSLESAEAYSSGVWNPAAASTSGRGLVKTLAAADEKEALTAEMLRVIESNEGWGRLPICQDTPWPLPTSMNWRKGDSSLWCSSQSNGTTVWESSRSINNAGSSANAHHMPGSWSDRRASAPLDRSGGHWTVPSLSRDSPSWGENAERVVSSNALDVQSWNGSNSTNRVRSRTPGSLPAPQGCAPNFTNGEGNRNSPPGAQGTAGTAGTQGEWITGGMKGFRAPDIRSSQPPWSEGGQAHGWSHENFFGAANSSRQLSQTVGRGDFTNSSMPWDQPAMQSSVSGSVAPPELGDWDQVGTLGSGSAAWPSSETSGNNRTSKAMHRDDPIPDWTAAGSAGSAAGRRGRYSMDAAMTVGWRNDADISEWARCNSGGSIQRLLLPPGSKQALNGTAPKTSAHNFSHQLPMRPHLMQKLLDMGFSKESAQKALIDNNMDLRQAVADLHRSAAGNPQSGVHAPRPLLPPADASISGGFPSSPLQMYPPGNVNTHLGNTPIGASIIGKPFPHVPPGRQQPFASAMPSKLPRQSPNASGWSSVGASQQAMQNLQYLINLGYIPPNALAKQGNNAVIEQMMNLVSAFQALQQQATRCSSPQMAAHHWEQLDIIKQKLAALGQSLADISQQRPHQGVPDATLPDEFAGLSLGQHQYVQPQLGQSKLAQWKVSSESDAGVIGQASRAPGAKPAMAAGSQGGLVPPDEVWSSTNASSRPKLDANHNESQSAVEDLHEFIPGRMWAGSPSLTGDDGLQSSGSPLSIGGSDEASGWSSSFAGMPRSLSMPSSSGGGWSLGTNAGPPASVIHSGPAGASGNADPHWSASMARASAPSGRPPPGLSNFSTSAKSAVGYGRRSSASACWSPSSGAAGAIGSGAGGRLWDAQSSSQWVILQNVPQHIDQTRLKSTCSLYGSVTAFLPNLAIGAALVQYGSAHEAAAAQGNLHNRFMGLQVQLVGEEEARSFVERTASHGGASSGAGSLVASSSAWSPAAPAPTTGAVPSAWSSGSAASASAMPGLANIVLGNLWSGGAGAGSEGSGSGSSAVGGNPYLPEY